MRWHHFADYLTVLGSVAFTEHGPGAGAGGGAARGRQRKGGELFDPEKAGTSRVERLDEATDNLLQAGSRAFQVAEGATISFGRRLYDRAGGPTRRWCRHRHRVRVPPRPGGRGFVPERDARSWHLGLSQLESRNEEGHRYWAPRRTTRPVAAGLTARGRPAVGVPYVEVVVDVAEATYEDASATVVGALTGTIADVAVTLVGPWSTLTDERRSPLVDPRWTCACFARPSPATAGCGTSSPCRRRRSRRHSASAARPASCRPWTRCVA